MLGGVKIGKRGKGVVPTARHEACGANSLMIGGVKIGNPGKGKLIKSCVSFLLSRHTQRGNKYIARGK